MEEYLIELRNFFRYLILSYRYLWNKRLFQIIGILSVILSYFRIIFGFLGKNDRNLIFKFCEIFFFNLSLKNRQMQNTGVNRFKLQKFPLNVNNYNSYEKYIDTFEKKNTHLQVTIRFFCHGIHLNYFGLVTQWSAQKY